MSEKQNITLRLDCHEVRLSVDRDKEEIYRKAAVTLNDTYKRYAARYPQLPVEKLWVYTALEVAVNLHSDMRDKDLQPLLQKIAELNQKIENKG
ncbi:MAG: cell division protein ZapA [Paludibacteraceae bacterium]|nr:cell division protein ZapA [Paludibacteraceae bacterium]